jgi:hypothetical protein
MLFLPSFLSADFYFAYVMSYNRTACISQQCKKTTAFICHRCLINTVVEKANNI